MSDPDLELSCDEDVDLSSAVDGDQEEMALELNHLEVGYQMFFSDEDGYQRAFPDVVLFDVMDEREVVDFGEMLQQYPLVGGTGETAAAHTAVPPMCAADDASVPAAVPTGLPDATNSVMDAPAPTAAASEGRDGEAAIMANAMPSVALSGVVDEQGRLVSKNRWHAYLAAHLEEAIVIPVDTTWNRAFLRQKHACNISCVDAMDGKLDFRVLYDEDQEATGWAFPITADAAALAALKQQYPGWRPVTMADLLLADPKLAWRSSEAAAGKSVGGDLGGAALPLPTVPKPTRLASKWMNSVEHFRSVLRRAGGWGKAVFVAMDMEAATVSRGACAYPLEISLIPFCFDPESADFTALPVRPAAGKGGDATTAMCPASGEDGGDDTAAVDSTKKQEAEAEAPAQSDAEAGEIWNEYHSFVHPGCIPELDRTTAYHNSLVTHGIPFHCSLLRNRYTALREELDWYVSNPSCVFISKGGPNAPVVSDPQAIRFLYAAAAWEAEWEVPGGDGHPAEAERQKAEQYHDQHDGEDHHQQEKRRDSSRRCGGGGPPLLEDMRFFNHDTVLRALAEDLGEELAGAPSRQQTAANGGEGGGLDCGGRTAEKEPPRGAEKPVHADEEKEEESEGVEEAENEVAEDSAEDAQEKHVDQLCWYHHRLHEFQHGAGKGGDDASGVHYHCAREDAWKLAYQLSEKIAKAVNREC